MTPPLHDKKPPVPESGVWGELIHPVQFQGDDTTLVRGMQEGHDGAFRVFYQRHASLVFRVLLRTIGSDNDLDILIQEVFSKAFQSIHSLKQAEQAKSWLASIAVHTARDTIKYRKRMRWLKYFEPSKVPEPKPPENTAPDLEALRAVYELLDKLSVDNRIAFTLRYMNEMELVEVAEVCNVSLATIKRRLAKARKQLFALADLHPALKEWVNHA